MSYGSDNSLSQPPMGLGGQPATNGTVYGQYTQGQPAPAQHPAHILAPNANVPQPVPQGQYQAPQAPYGVPSPTPNYANAPAAQPPVGTAPTQVWQNGVPQGNYGFPNQPQDGFGIGTPNQPVAPTVPNGFNLQTGHTYAPQPVDTPTPQTAQGQAITQPSVGETYIESAINHLTSTLGVSPDNFDKVIEAAVQYGDVNLINPNALGVQLTPEQHAQVKQLATSAVQYVQAESARETARIDAIAYAAAGSKEAWDSAVGVFAANADAQAKGYASYLISQGNHQAAAELVMQTVRGYGYAPQGNAPVTASAVAGQRGLTAQEFKDAIGELSRRAGNQSLEQGSFARERENLMHLRQLGRNQGLA